jgi:RNA recognition motif-containing protein
VAGLRKGFLSLKVFFFTNRKYINMFNRRTTGGGGGGGRASTGRGEALEPSSTLFIGNMSFTSTKESLSDAFKDYNIYSARIITEKDTGMSRGFGYIEFSSVQDATRVYFCCVLCFFL